MYIFDFSQDVVDDYGNFWEYITDRLEQILCEENAHACVEFERSTRFDREVDTFRLNTRILIIFIKDFFYFAATMHFFTQKLLNFCRNYMFSELTLFLYLDQR